MRYKLFGRSGLQVSELCLGTLEFGVAHGTEDPLVEALEIFECFAEAGGNFLDTSDDYGKGLSEEVIGDLVQRDRDHFVIATKYGTDMGGRIRSCAPGRAVGTCDGVSRGACGDSTSRPSTCCTCICGTSRRSGPKS